MLELTTRDVLKQAHVNRHVFFKLRERYEGMLQPTRRVGNGAMLWPPGTPETVRSLLAAREEAKK